MRKTKSDLNVWYRWCESVREIRRIDDIPSQELNRLLSHFFVGVKKANGEEYGPNTLTSYQRSIDRYIRETAGQTRSIITDKVFEGS